MKCVLFLAAIVAVASAQNWWNSHDELAELVRHEVKAIVAADSSITLDGCAQICDDLFDLITPADEDTTDKACRGQCDCEINHHNCQQQHLPWWGHQDN